MSEGKWFVFGMACLIIGMLSSIVSLALTVTR